MPYQTPQQLKKSVKVWRAASAVLFLLSFFIGVGNLTYADKVGQLDKSLRCEKGISQFYKSRYQELVESGACRNAAPDYE